MNYYAIVAMFLKTRGLLQRCLCLNIHGWYVKQGGRY